MLARHNRVGECPPVFGRQARLAITSDVRFPEAEPMAQVSDRELRESDSAGGAAVSGLPRALRLAARVALALGIAFVGYFLIYRPEQLRWGATEQEIARAMPGDELQPHPVFNATRAITIDAPPERIWPWLVQIGYQRA